MNVLFLATLPPESSTIVGRTLPLATALKSRGHDVRLLTLGDLPHSSGMYDGIPVTIAGPSLRGDTSARPPLSQTLRRFWAGRAGLTQAAVPLHPACVILVKPHPQNVSIAQKISCPVILDVDDDERWALRLRFPERWLMEYVERRAASRAALVTACSPALVERYRHELHARQVEYVPTGITPSTAAAPDLRRMFRLPPEAKIILYIGSLAVSSGHRVDQLLAAWDALAANDPNLHLVCAGGGIHAEGIQAQAASLRLGARVHFSGRYKAEEAQGLVKQATLLVDPVDNTAAARAKSSSRMLLALLTGVPIVAGDVGIRRDMLPSPCRSKALYAPGNPVSLLTALRYGLTPAAREQFSKATRDSWQRWSWETVGTTFAALVENAVR